MLEVEKKEACQLIFLVFITLFAVLLFIVVTMVLMLILKWMQRRISKTRLAIISLLLTLAAEILLYIYENR